MVNQIAITITIAIVSLVLVVGVIVYLLTYIRQRNKDDESRLRDLQTTVNKLLINEGLNTSTILALQQSVSSINTSISDLSQKVAISGISPEITARINSLSAQISALKTTVTHNSADISDVFTAYEDTNLRLTRIEQNNDVSRVSVRVDNLERRINAANIPG